MSVAYPSWPSFSDDEIKAAEEVLRSGKVNYWTGKEVHQFEEEFAAAVGCDKAVALANGTLALELALNVFGFEPGDEVIVTPRTFVASASAIVMQGLRPIFADVDPDSGNITADTIAKVITPKTRAIIAVHICGWPCDMDPIMDLAREHDLKVIEDCAQAHGATYNGRPCGSLGDIAAWSFCQDKIMTTGGEGGMITLSDEALWKKAWAYKDHGKSYDTTHEKPTSVGFRWLHEDFGTNWRMTEMQAAIGRVQLRKLPEWTKKRRENASVLNERFSQIPLLRVPVPGPDIGHAFYKLHEYVRPELFADGWTRDRILTICGEQGIPCRYGICGEIYMEKAFEKAGLRPAERLPVAKMLGEQSLMFMVHPTLSPVEMNDVADRVIVVLDEASR
jgi:dTDP-4-amino-4,6-dideoxygalactose transaminase